MKKSIVTILAFLYLAISSGMVVNIHYCMGKVSKVELDNFSKAVCKCGSGKKPMACCKDELKLIKLTDSHKATTLATVFAAVIGDPIVLPLSLIQLPFSNAPVNILQQTEDPPLITQTPVYVINRVFRI